MILCIISNSSWSRLREARRLTYTFVIELDCDFERIVSYLPTASELLLQHTREDRYVLNINAFSARYYTTYLKDVYRRMMLDQYDQLYRLSLYAISVANSRLQTPVPYSRISNSRPTRLVHRLRTVIHAVASTTDQSRGDSVVTVHWTRHTVLRK